MFTLFEEEKSAKQIVQQLFYTNTAVQTNCTMRERESKRYLNTFSIISNKKNKKYKKNSKCSI